MLIFLCSTDSAQHTNISALTSLKQLSTAADTRDRPNEGCSDNSSGMRAKSRKMEASRRLWQGNLSFLAMLHSIFIV